MECQVRGVNMHYQEYGEGRPVLLLHGYYPDHRLMSGCMEPVFRERPGFRRIYPDLPGMGGTGRSEAVADSDAMLETVLAFIDRVVPNGNFLLAGESYGGYLARGILARIGGRVDGLLLICPMIVPDKEQRSVPAHTVLRRDDALMATVEPKLREEFVNMAVVQDENCLRRFSEEIWPGLTLADGEYLEKLRCHGYAFSDDVDGSGPQYTRPTLILTGRQDASVGYSDAWRLLEKYPRATFAVLDRAGHNLQIEQDAVFRCLVNEWLDRAAEA